MPSKENEAFSSTTDWLDYDKAHVWHPYSSMSAPQPVVPILRAEGVELALFDGRKLIDGMSSWWSAIHGYNVPELNAAVNDQVGQLSHVMFGGLTHKPAIGLAKRLIDLTAAPLQQVFFSDSGSVSVEVAIKMALQYWFAQGKSERRRLLTVRGGYHGDTFGAMSVSDPTNGMHNLFSGNLTEQLFAEAPCSLSGDQSTQPIDDFERLISQHCHELAAVIIEPMVQGAGGMRFYDAAYLKQVRTLCDKSSTLLILDEIATGFGRTGTLFAYEQADIVPDILCLGKALTGGYMTLAATLTTQKVATTIDSGGEGVFMHGPTFMANPLACSVANASIDLLLASPWQQRVNAIEAQMAKELAPCRQFSKVYDVRTKGAIGVVELVDPVDMATLQSRLVDLGVWLRPFGRLIYIMPPYIISSEDLSKLTTAVVTVITEMEGSVGC